MDLRTEMKSKALVVGEVEDEEETRPGIMKWSVWESRKADYVINA